MNSKDEKYTINLLKKEIQDSRKAAEITASLVVKEFEKREVILQRLYEKSEVEKKLRSEQEQKVDELEAALEEIKTLKGIIPICASCKNIRDDKGYWDKIRVVYL